MQGGGIQEQGAYFPLGLTLELNEELQDSIITWTVPYKQLSTDQQRAAWFVDGNSKVNGQHPVFKDAILFKEGKISAWWSELHAVILAMMKEFKNGKKPPCLGFY